MIVAIEAKLLVHLRKGLIDMAFMVILQLNIEDAMRANATTAVQIMTHMETLIQEYQDQQVSAPVRLMRMLVRAEDGVVRKAMLRQKLLIGANVAAAERARHAPAPVRASGADPHSTPFRRLSGHLLGVFTTSLIVWGWGV